VKVQPSGNRIRQSFRFKLLGSSTACRGKMRFQPSVKDGGGLPLRSAAVTHVSLSSGVDDLWSQPIDVGPLRSGGNSIRSSAPLGGAGDCSPAEVDNAIRVASHMPRFAHLRPGSG